MRYIFLFLLLFIFGNQYSFSSNGDSIQHRLSAFTQFAVEGDFNSGQLLGVEYGVQKSFYGVSISFSQYYHNEKRYFPYWPSHIYIPVSYSSKMISLTPFFYPIQKKWFALNINAGVTFSREDFLYSTIATPVTLESGDVRLDGNYIIDTNYIFGATCGIGLDFKLSKSLTLFANSRLVIMQYPGIGQVLIGGGFRFNI